MYYIIRWPLRREMPPGKRRKAMVLMRRGSKCKYAGYTLHPRWGMPDKWRGRCRENLIMRCNEELINCLAGSMQRNILMSAERQITGYTIVA